MKITSDDDNIRQNVNNLHQVNVNISPPMTNRNIPLIPNTNSPKQPILNSPKSQYFNNPSKENNVNIIVIYQ